MSCVAVAKKIKKRELHQAKVYTARAKCRLFKRTSNLQRALDSKFSERFYIVGSKWKKKQRLSPERVTRIMFARAWSTQRLAMLIFIVKQITDRFFSPLSSPFRRSLCFFHPFYLPIRQTL